MTTTIKNFVTSILVGLVTYAAISYIRNQTINIPASASDYTELVVIIIGLLVACFFISATSDTYIDIDGEERETGTVKWFNVNKGYGFITRDQGEDIFVHYRNIEGSGRRSINEGQRVSFVVIDGDKGLQADEVVAV
ncbi:MAG TPA: cold-shock protein [Gammaproteobacteria bacterium]|nr:cold-shock protein [Gammaproteobacteria bacterium]|tara:strand:- start:113 stop:523 length:411 start_codon:yes stop_codon:yes gene_type:complete